MDEAILKSLIHRALTSEKEYKKEVKSFKKRCQKRLKKIEDI